MQYLLLQPVVLEAIRNMLPSKYKSQISLCSRLFHTLRTLRWVHILDDLDGMLGHFIVQLFFLRGDLANQLIRILKGTFSSQLPVQVF
jgi:hypothetical protein